MPKPKKVTYTDYAGKKIELPETVPYADEQGKVYAWNDPRFTDSFEGKNFLDLGTSLVKNEAEWRDRKEAVDEKQSEMEDDRPIKEANEVRKGIHGYQDKGPGMSGVNEMPNAKVMLTSYAEPETAREYRKLRGEMAAELRKDAKEIKDAKASRFYEDMAYMIDPASGKYLQAIATNPYLNNIGGILHTGPDVTEKEKWTGKVTIDEVKTALGEDLYNSLMDIRHAGIEAFRIEYERQKTLETEGWSDEAEKAYLEELKKNHKSFLEHFENLNKYSDPERKLDRYMGNPLEHDLGRNAGDSRDLRSCAGSIRGELQAINNGWGSADLHIMAIIGGLDAQLDKWASYGNDADKSAASKLQQDFLKIKDKIWDKKNPSAEEKLEILNDLKDFAGKQPKSKYISMLSNNLEILDNIGKVLEADKRLEAKIGEFEMLTPEIEDLSKEQVRAKLERLEKSGDVAGLFSYMTDIQEKSSDHMHMPAVEAISEYQESLVSLTKDNKDFAKKDLLKALINEAGKNIGELQLQVGREKEEKEEQIRNGNVEHTQNLIGNDKAIRSVANKIVDIAGVNAKRLASMNAITAQIGMLGDADVEIDGMSFSNWLTKTSNDAANAQKNTHTELSAEKRQAYYDRGMNGGEDIDKYGYKVNPDGANPGQPLFTQIPVQAMNAEELKQFEDRQVKLGEKLYDYKTAVTDLKDAAMEKLAQLEAMKKSGNNSTEYDAMHDALKEVANLKADGLPEIIESKLKTLSEAAQAYQKRNDVFYRAIRQPGKDRLAMSKDLQTFVKDWNHTLEEKSAGISKEDKISRQIDTARKHLDSTAREKAARNPQAPAAQNPEVPAAQNGKEPEKGRRKMEKEEVQNLLQGNRREGRRSVQGVNENQNKIERSRTFG